MKAAKKCDSKCNGFAARASQMVSRFRPRNLSNRGFIPIANTISVDLKAETIEEIDEIVFELSICGAICRFRGFWPSLS